jgi:hypothetical protein
MRCWSPLASTRCEPERLVSIHPSHLSAASTRAALAMHSTVEHGHVKLAGIMSGFLAAAPEWRTVGS